MGKYNTTQLNPDTCFERHVYHRDQFAHYLRWTHVLNRAKIGQKILDFGCGSGNLAEVFYRNRFKAALYLGLDVRAQAIAQNREKFKAVPWVQFQQADLCADLALDSSLGPWDIVCSFEVLEHIGHDNGDRFMQNIRGCMKACTTLLLSTPCYDQAKGAADNHMIDGKVGEYTFAETKALLEKYFRIVSVWGTFASQKDYLPALELDPALKGIFDQLKDYYDTNLLAVLFAPLFPQLSRNCLWECQLC